MENQESPVIRESVRFVGDVGPLFEALAKAQADFKPMDRDASVTFSGRQFNYSTLAEVLSSVVPALNKHGIFLCQPFDGGEVLTVLALGSARIEALASIPKWNTVQDLGSAITYIRRYQVKAILGVNDGEDDDGNAASGTGKTPVPRQRATPPEVKAPLEARPDAVTTATKERIKALAKDVGYNGAALEGFCLGKQLGPLTALTEEAGQMLATHLENLKVSK